MTTKSLMARASATRKRERIRAVLLRAVDMLVDVLVDGAGGDGAAHYSTASPADWPPGCRSRRMARDRICAVPEHERIGKGRATIARVSIDAYHVHYTRPPLAKAEPASSQSDDAIAERAIEDAGLRSTRRTA